MALKPCIRCGQAAVGSYCPSHRRNRNLARDLLTQIAARDGWVCQLCFEPVTHRGHDAKAAALDHIDNDVTNDHPNNLRLAHNGCNAARG